MGQDWIRSKSCENQFRKFRPKTFLTRIFFVHAILALKFAFEKENQGVVVEIKVTR
jgi:hypothetical protein